jgi:hypothetical protein
MLQGAFDDDTGRQLFQYTVNRSAKVVGTKDQPHLRVMVRPIPEQQIENLKNIAVKGRLAAQKPDPLPLDFPFHTVPDKGRNHGYWHFHITGSLPAGTIAVEASQVAFVCQVDFGKFKTRPELPACHFDQKRLGADKLIRIHYQAFDGNIPMAERRFHKE